MFKFYTVVLIQLRKFFFGSSVEEEGYGKIDTVTNGSKRKEKIIFID